MPASYSDIATFLKKSLSNATGIGVIYTEPKDFRTQEEIQTNCFVQSKLNYWYITRASVRNSLEFIDGTPVPIGGIGARIHSFEIHGFYGYIQDDSPSSYLTFQNIVTSVLDVLQPRKTKAEVGDSQVVINSTEAEIESDLGSLADAYICYHARLTVSMEEMYSVSYF
jgi:hypothetical protein